MNKLEDYVETRIRVVAHIVTQNTRKIVRRELKKFKKDFVKSMLKPENKRIINAKKLVK